MSDMNNTPNVTENIAADAPEALVRHLHRRGCPTGSRGIVREWWWLRISAALLVPLSVWFLTILVTRVLTGGVDALAQWLANPLAVLCMVLLFCFGFLHTRLGVHEIIVDYVHAPAKKRAANLLVDLLSLVLALGSIAAVIQLHRMA